ncbi:hypothetical protein ETB97_004548 [Aspergillus alliaceus]|uniref:Uncharacterized protein n=1 Tax=Petromyces alliaceus TaxID=209559 RepID=A0A8H6EAB1_PETAA|nr:hypothetical protein ETB97_004548 [Aspergillus burnettii]
MEAKRVILYAKDHDFPDPSFFQDVDKCVNSFLSLKGLAYEELAQGKHHYHIHPPNPDIPQRSPSFHIFIDLAIANRSSSGALEQDFPHEIYRVFLLDGGFKFGFHKDKRAAVNWIQKIRLFSDRTYPWGEGLKRNQSSINDHEQSGEGHPDTMAASME